MQFSEQWLRTIVDPDLSSAQLSHLLTMSGLEVEEITPAGADFSGIVVAQVLETARHPNADRLTVCTVQVDAKKTLTIVCGASNVRPGIKVPCALPGAVLPANDKGESLHIVVGELRGVESQGMLCSARELKLNDDRDGLFELPNDAPVGVSLREFLSLDDHCFTIKLTPNKADCLSLLGVAREVSALTGAQLKRPPCSPAAVTSDENLAVHIDAPDLCGRFSGRIVKQLNAAAVTPLWMKQRLERSGQRSISALIDISNYVMLELGQPTHVFDLDKVHGGLTVRWGKSGETIKLLNGTSVTVDEKVGVIADDRGIESLAGIMGGDATSVSLETVNVYIESAFWQPDAIQGRSRRFNFSTDAGHRFERGVDFEGTVPALERITALMLEICGTAETLVGSVNDQVCNLPKRQPVSLRTARAARVIGVPLSNEDIAQVFKRLDLVATLDGDTFHVTPPSHRFDIEIEEDLIEEVARIHGFEKIPALMPKAVHTINIPAESTRSLFDLRHRMVDLDFHEVINFSFISEAAEQKLHPGKEPIRLRNPIASQFNVMRSSLLPGLLDNVQYNVNRKVARIRIFEIGAVFERSGDVTDGPLTVAGFAQPKHIAAVAFGTTEPEQWGTPSIAVDYFDLKADLEALAFPKTLTFSKTEHPLLHPGRSAAVWCDGVEIGILGELHPRVQQEYELLKPAVMFDVDLALLQQRPVPVYQALSRFPAVTRDLAVVVAADCPAQSLIDSMQATQHESASCGAVQAIVLFDEYRGKGLENNKKSLAFRVTLQDTKSTLQDEHIDNAIGDLVAGLKRDVGAELRT